MMALALAALYALGAVLMRRQFRMLTTLELSDQPAATPTRLRVPMAALVFWPVAVAVLVGADLWVAVARYRARPRSLQWRS